MKELHDLSAAIGAFAGLSVVTALSCRHLRAIFKGHLACPVKKITVKKITLCSRKYILNLFSKDIRAPRRMRSERPVHFFSAAIEITTWKSLSARVVLLKNWHCYRSSQMFVFLLDPFLHLVHFHPSFLFFCFLFLFFFSFLIRRQLKQQCCFSKSSIATSHRLLKVASLSMSRQKDGSSSSPNCPC